MDLEVKLATVQIQGMLSCIKSYKTLRETVGKSLQKIRKEIFEASNKKIL
jgi:hypothetical protein